jgi:hypothetical protein
MAIPTHNYMKKIFCRLGAQPPLLSAPGRLRSGKMQICMFLAA